MPEDDRYQRPMVLYRRFCCDDLCATHPIHLDLVQQESQIQEISS